MPLQLTDHQCRWAAGRPIGSWACVVRAGRFGIQLARVSFGWVGRVGDRVACAPETAACNRPRSRAVYSGGGERLSASKEDGAIGIGGTYSNALSSFFFFCGDGDCAFSSTCLSLSMAQRRDEPRLARAHEQLTVGQRWWWMGDTLRPVAGRSMQFLHAQTPRTQRCTCLIPRRTNSENDDKQGEKVGAPRGNPPVHSALAISARKSAHGSALRPLGIGPRREWPQVQKNQALCTPARCKSDGQELGTLADAAQRRAGAGMEYQTGSHRHRHPVLAHAPKAADRTSVAELSITASQRWRASGR